MNCKHIRIVSPSGVIDPNYVKGAVRRLEGWGYRVSIGAHALGAAGRFSGSVEERMSDLQRACDDDGIDIILCSRGGYGLAQYADKIRLNPRQLVVGFSDITCLHSLAGQSGISSLHGLMCKHIASLPSQSRALREFRALLEAWSNNEPLPEVRVPAHKLNRKGCATGILRGGNLSVLYGLRGTALDIPHDGRGTILFIEDISECAYHIDRMMQSLRMGGILANLSGLAVGQFSDCDEDPQMTGSIMSRIADMVSEYEYPVCFNFPAGHTDKNLPLMLNTRVRIDITNRGTTLTYNI